MASLFKSSEAHNAVVGFFLLFNILSPAVVWQSDLGVFSKVFLTLLVYVASYIAIFLVTFTFARCFFLHSCALG